MNCSARLRSILVSTDQHSACGEVPAGRGSREVTWWSKYATRRDLLLTSLLAALPFRPTGAAANPLNLAQTIIKLPDALQWETQPSFPQGSADICRLTGDSPAPGLYYVLIRWHPGYMSAPHTYTTDRFCVVVSGSWWVNSGAELDPASCVPAPAGSFVHPRGWNSALRRRDP